MQAMAQAVPARDILPSPTDLMNSLMAVVAQCKFFVCYIGVENAGQRAAQVHRKMDTSDSGCLLLATDEAPLRRRRGSKASRPDPLGAPYRLRMLLLRVLALSTAS